MEYGKLENGNIEYAIIQHGGLVVNDSVVFVSESKYDEYGYYRVENVNADGWVEDWQTPQADIEV